MSDFVFIFIIFIIAMGGMGIAIFYIKKNSAVALIKQDLKEIREEIKESREKSIESLQNQLRQSADIIRNVTSQLEKIHSDQQHIIELKTDLNKLNEILANPKQRGVLGEYFLETLLKNIFHPHQYKLQYKFKDGETVDAVIFVKDKIIPVDAKFSLENYNRITEEKNPEKRAELEKKFRQDLKLRIEETSKYIRPNENTMDFAFMFIPSEGIYYDLLINQIGGIKSQTSDLIEYAFKEKRVIIVSPTSFYAYLQTVLQGLRAVQIEESAKEIIKKIQLLQKHLLKYDEFLQRLGDHLGKTVNAYNKAYKEFDKIDKDVIRLTGEKKKIKPLELEKPDNNEE